MGISSLGYVILEMQDPQSWATFGTQVMGFGVADHVGAPGDVFLRMDDAPFRYRVTKGDENRFTCAGFEVPSAAAFSAMVAKLTAEGVSVETGSAEEAQYRAVSEFAKFSDPSGNQVEIYHGRVSGSPFTPGHGIKEFKTGTMGLGHLVLPAPENQATIDFYQDFLGFGVSDDLNLPPFAEGFPDQRIYFMHADNPRHHTLGLYNFPNPTGVVHIMAEVGTIDEVGACMDRVKQAGHHIFASLGRHENDEMISFYFFAPGGIGMEVGYDGKQVGDWSQFTPTKSTLGDIWGHEYDFPMPEA